MNKVSSFELYLNASFYVLFFIGYQIYCTELEKQSYAPISHETRRILWGFENLQGTNYPELVSVFTIWPHFTAYSLLCLLFNLFNVPHKTEVLAFISLGFMAAFYGFTLTGVIIAMMISMAIIGKCLQGIKVLPQAVGLLFLVFIPQLLEELPWLNFPQHVMYSDMAYSGFYAQVVRAMLICCDCASETKPISWRRLLSESIGFSAFTNVFMSASFIVFTDWKQWHDGEHEYVWSGPFKLVPKKRVGKATVIRTLSLLRLILRILQVAFWACIHKYCMCGVNIIRVLSPIVERILQNQAEFSDLLIFTYATALVVMRFNVYYIVYYKISRLVGDFQQFLLSPAFSSNSDKIIGGDESVKKAWRQTNIIEKLFKIDIETECLMPGGPCWTMSAKTSSEIWRKFDIGLYNILKYYIYIPWMEVVNWAFCRGDGNRRSKLSPLLSNFSAICGAIFTFIFVLTYHNWTKGNKIWVMLSFSFWLIERTAIQYFRDHNTSEYLEKRLSPAWEHRIRTGACALLQIANLISFCYFVTNYATGDFVMKTILTHPYKVGTSWQHLRSRQALTLLQSYCTAEFAVVVAAIWTLVESESFNYAELPFLWRMWNGGVEWGGGGGGVGSGWERSKVGW
nr:membrane bound acyltransferase:hhat [Hymenolepis microstoma]